MIYNVKLAQSYLIFLFVPAFFSSASSRAFGFTKLRAVYSGFLLGGLLLTASCTQSTKPDISAIHLDVKIERFDQDLYAGKTKDISSTDQTLKKKYGFFYDDFMQRIIGNPSYTNPEILSTLYKDQAFTDLYTETDSVFKDLKPIEQELTEAFKYIKYYYPKSRTPRFISFISGFAVQTPIGDNYMGIGLDMFLGKNSKFYGAIVTSVPTYLSRRFSPEYIVPRLTETYSREELFPARDEDRTLISRMIQNGKILYFMDQVLSGQVPDSVKIGYTMNQLEWCKTFEPDIWGFFLENNLLFETDYQKIQVYLSEGPFTPGLGEKRESAPKLGVWVGWQIVRKYMQENKDITLQQLMKEQDTQKILNLSRYKPK
ncbi:gliding motility lipoprotein GldB [Pedobacter metabolipauper]|uniref:Gliding motility-associated lipoprotein GldB n=1 Tax=Pedobacter metabolipauper TaxID=425513 RepID=A0A4R6SPY3_9SPHI|nr:gliding motility lipoprotein GldB [Pedobacter metabolipauper]TDQ06679.1 gliding motility-associated lipoprotein GldB [Pedobacter metabolipauper]